jgi:hypothetical protein
MLKENSAELHADVLKVGHHGSKNSTTQEFLDAVVAHDCDHFAWGRQSLWTSPRGIAGTIGSERGAGVENGPGWRGAYCDGR